ncbi:hypothetical protein PPYR_15514 [Photinus pyralis]|uniref:Uncharacterized protein n=1 Tax=Photinus pyralis TaxID=7054 RepID=A0A1Y1KAV1_PHOPY|nr:hypothetical protein PPYR_15514 [Photinus pyralis]
MEVEKRKLYLELPENVSATSHSASPVNELPTEIKDIYDSIYGNVQSKLEYYESRSRSNSRSSSKSSTPTSDNRPIFHYSKSHQEELKKNEVTPPTTPLRQLSSESAPTLDLLKDCSMPCSKCEKTKFVKDRTEILSEINTNFKLELANVKKHLKTEIEKNNALNFEIANIEHALETYYEEAKYQKNTISVLYTSLKNFTRHEGTYTYKRIKAISDYVETLKAKLQHQDRIIRDNFVENPYTTDMMMKYESLVQQIDVLSIENQELKNDIRRKADEEVEIIKELNRQKFKVEERCKELESFHKREMLGKDAFIAALREEHEAKDGEVETALERKVEEMAAMKKTYEAKIANYKDEIAIVYRRWRNDVSERGGSDSFNTI